MAKSLNKAFSDANILANWKYSPEEWNSYYKEEFKKQKFENWGLFLTIAIITIIVGGIFTLTHRDAWKALTIGLLGLLVLIAIIAFTIPRFNYSRNRKNTDPEVIICLNGIYIAEEFHIWNFFSSKLENVCFDENGMLISAGYSYRAKTGTGHREVRVPVSVSRLEEAKILVEKLRKT